MRPGSERNALFSTESPEYLLSIRDVVDNLKKKNPKLKKIGQGCLFFHGVGIVLICSTFSGGPK